MDRFCTDSICFRIGNDLILNQLTHLRWCVATFTKIKKLKYVLVITFHRILFREYVSNFNQSTNLQRFFQKNKLIFINLSYYFKVIFTNPLSRIFVSRIWAFEVIKFITAMETTLGLKTNMPFFISMSVKKLVRNLLLFDISVSFVIVVF